MVDPWHLIADTIQADRRLSGKRLYRWNGTRWAEQMRVVIERLPLPDRMAACQARVRRVEDACWSDAHAPQPADLNTMTLEEWRAMVEALVKELPHAGQ